MTLAAKVKTRIIVTCRGELSGLGRIEQGDTCDTVVSHYCSES